MSIAPTTMRANERPVFVSKETTAVHGVVSSWHGRTLRVQPTPDLQRAAAALEAYEGRLADLSPHAPRLLGNLRAELAKPERQSAASRPLTQPVAGIPVALQRAAAAWSEALLSERTTTELQRALDTVCKHPDAYGAEDSIASTARRRLTAEISQRVTARLNQLNTTRKVPPLA